MYTNYTVYTLYTYYMHNNRQYNLVLLYFLISQRTLQRFKPETLNCQRAHQRVGAPRTLQLCLAKTDR